MRLEHFGLSSGWWFDISLGVLRISIFLCFNFSFPSSTSSHLFTDYNWLVDVFIEWLVKVLVIVVDWQN